MSQTLAGRESSGVPLCATAGSLPTGHKSEYTIPLRRRGVVISHNAQFRSRRHRSSMLSRSSVQRSCRAGQRQHLLGRVVRRDRADDDLVQHSISRPKRRAQLTSGIARDAGLDRRHTHALEVRGVGRYSRIGGGLSGEPGGCRRPKGHAHVGVRRRGTPTCAWPSSGARRRPPHSPASTSSDPAQPRPRQSPARL
jgi:hypothetical protein